MGRSFGKANSRPPRRWIKVWFMTRKMTIESMVPISENKIGEGSFFFPHVDK